MTAAALPLVIDTDLGSDVDDELALAFVWGSPEFDLRGVVVSYGDVALRARIALRMCELIGVDVPVALGESATRSGAPVWWAGHEGDAYGALDPLPGDLPTAGELLDSLESDAHLLAIAPFGTVAAQLDRGTAARVTDVTAMGADFSGHRIAEHNVSSDVDAARLALAGSIPTTLVPLDVTRRVHLLDADIDRIEAAGALGAIIAAEARAWMRRWDEPFEVPHDPLAALAIIRPDLFVVSLPGTVLVEDDGVVRFEAGPDTGRVRVVREVDAAAAAREIVDRVIAGLTAEGSIR